MARHVDVAGHVTDVWLLDHRSSKTKSRGSCSGTIELAANGYVIHEGLLANQTGHTGRAGMRRACLVTAAALVALTSAILALPTAHARAASAFNPAEIIDDSVFRNTNVMSASAIDQFIASMEGGQSCPSSGTTMCLKDYRQNPTNLWDNFGSPRPTIAGGE